MNKQSPLLREKRSVSISPTLSFNNSIALTEAEKQEKNYYGTTINEMVRDLFAAFDDIIKHINFHLIKSLFPILKKDLKQKERDELVDKFLNVTFEQFSQKYDKGEIEAKRFFSFSEMAPDVCNYVSSKEKEEKSGLAEKIVNDNFAKERNKYFSLVRENLKLRMQLEVEKKIGEFRRVKSPVNIISEINNSMMDKKYLDIIDKNLDIMESKYSEMCNMIEKL